MKANSDKSKQSNKATRHVLAGVLCGASVLSLVLSLVMPPISQAIANDAEAAPTEEAVADENTLDEEAVQAIPRAKTPKTGLVTTVRVAREKTLLRRIRLPMTREPRALRSPRMMGSLSIRPLLLQMKVRLGNLK